MLHWLRTLVREAVYRPALYNTSGTGGGPFHIQIFAMIISFANFYSPIWKNYFGSLVVFTIAWVCSIYWPRIEYKFHYHLTFLAIGGIALIVHFLSYVKAIFLSCGQRKSELDGIAYSSVEKNRFKFSPGVLVMWMGVLSFSAFVIVSVLKTDLYNPKKNLTRQYNIVLFFFFTGIIFGGYLFYLSCKLAYRLSLIGFARAGYAFVAGVFIVWIMVMTMMHSWYVETSDYAMKIQYMGNYGVEFEQGVCSFEFSRGFMDYLKPRTLNFFIGSMTCGDDDGTKHFSSLKNGILSVQCATEAEVFEAPDFISYRHEKDFESLHKMGYNSSTVVVKEPFGYIKPVAIKSEFVRVRCGDIYNFHMQVVEKKDLVKRLTNSKKKWAKDKMDFLFITLDSVSRAQMFRRMPKTVKAIEQIGKKPEVDFFQFLKFNVIFCCTQAMMKPLFEGSFIDNHDAPFDEGNPESGYRGIYSYTQQEKFGEKNPNVFPKNISYTGMFKYLQHRGYATGFELQNCPDDHFEAETYKYIDHLGTWGFCHPQLSFETTTFQGQFSIAPHCMDNRFSHNYMLDYAESFLKTYKEQSKMFSMLIQDGHEGSGEVAASNDDDLSKWLLKLDKEGALENTVVVIHGDHGLHMGPYPFTEAGQVEFLNPYLNILLPKKFTDKHAEFAKNLASNEQSLMTVYDLHATMMDIIHMTSGGGEKDFTSRGESLVRKNVRKRTCKEANMGHFEYCPCTEYRTSEYKDQNFLFE
eukprot:Nk52_evm46s270 gene=Nk52_evmTU46s270